jgi:hypothetical protein
MSTRTRKALHHPTNPGTSESLRAAMVDRLVADHASKGLIMRPEVEAALRAVPRHLFTRTLGSRRRTARTWPWSPSGLAPRP